MLPSAKDFEFKKLVGDTSEFEEALATCQDKFNSVLQKEYEKAAEEQTRLADRMKATDKQAAEAVNKMNALNKAPFSKLVQSIDELSKQLSSVQSTISSIVDDLYAIDTKLPVPEQFLAPSLPHKAQFPELTHLMYEKQLLQPVAVENVVAEVDIDCHIAQADISKAGVDVRAQLRSYQS